MKKLSSLFFVLLLLSACTTERDPFWVKTDKANALIPTLKFNQEIEIKSGFYKGCVAVLQDHVTWFNFTCKVYCPEIFPFERSIDPREFIE